MYQVPQIKLNNGIEIPQLGLGTYLLTGNSGKKAILEALKIGYRLLDTATLYGNEREVGKAIRESGIPREEIFITSKVWNSDQGYHSTLNAFDTSLSKLKSDYVDLYLIHWPVEGLRLKTWEALEKLYNDGKCKAIGVSNFYISHLTELLSHSFIKPTVNQVEFNPFLYLPELLGFCEENNIQMECYSPLSHGQTINNKKLLPLTKKYNKKPAQLILRWCLQHGTIVIPKSSNQEHLRTNLNIFDFMIEKNDMEIMNEFHQNLHTDWDPSDVL